jgi:hypothetical protein
MASRCRRRTAHDNPCPWDLGDGPSAGCEGCKLLAGGGTTCETDSVAFLRVNG